ncbi:MAG: sodium:solute symporter [Halieaceae bacterium]|nr:sodium:solute symporter [Halieaceae bacterium]
MTPLDWAVVGVYLLAMLALAAWLGRRQGSPRDYFLAGGQLPAPALAVSILATQCSTNSLLGAPAFVGFALGGGLLWLQYELAVPLAMLALMLIFPAIHRSRPISVYAFLEDRLGRRSRLVASGCFLFFRGVATGITVYGVASVLALITGTSYLTAVLLLMGVTVAYDVLGGMRAVVISDAIQMVLLVAAVAIALFQLSPLLAPLLNDSPGAEAGTLALRSRPLLDDWGLSGRSDFGFWPMLFGGVFLYVAYYGFDQSQAQRLLAAHDGKALRHILLLNGLLRFPLVLAYCTLGLGLAAYAAQQSGFLESLPLTAGGEPNINLVFPHYVQERFPAGLAGLAIVGLFAAAMSSIDSALNSLSASTMEDFSARWGGNSDRQRFLCSKVVTLGWGLFAIAFSFSVELIADTILEAINKVGSLFNGPLLGLFLIAIFLRGTDEGRVLLAFTMGFATNLLTWQLLPQISWLWWNVIGAMATVGIALLLSPQALRRAIDPMDGEAQNLILPTLLLLAFVAMLLLLVALQLR